LLDQVFHDSVDLAVSMYIEIIQSIFKRAETKRNKEISEHGKSLNDKVIIFAGLARLVLDEAGIPDSDLRRAIFHLVPKERLASAVQECDEIAQPADFAPLSFASRSYSYLRHFGPHFLKTMQFQVSDKDSSLLEAITFMREVDDGKRPFTEPPTKFVPWRWKTYITDHQKVVKRQMYELCLHECIAKAFEHGELWAPESRTYTSFKKDWISDTAWQETRPVFIEQYPELDNAETFIKQAQTALDQQMAEANRKWPDLQDEVWIEKDAVHLARLEARDLPAGVPARQIG
jgi:hypothetical protein